mgnify:CR=1 FL=1
MGNCARTRTHTDALKKLVEEEAAAVRRQREEDLDKNDNNDKDKDEDKDKEEEARLLAQEDKWAQVLAAIRGETACLQIQRRERGAAAQKAARAPL